ncbi:hypothetical protein M409DRAFT_28484 [Zasmidium cellare ATCC 36951]|uniref:GATA-type domain-containing protein n=1 Tax=Zasmidium cellare ATCC 36951 TaxID=1080233 RepID=A0A6A6C6Y7_ZASCE|nr:uncharacterized protein M409DRAFT_28484 [Zasmidium cellare ATCC 36951]KAF2161156.1 hypothetical protein M409DRAFT_28484 [Zasmidium cellare ATCC 36951]
MLQYAVPNAPQAFQRPPSVFADPPSRSSNTAHHHENNFAQNHSLGQSHNDDYYHQQSFSSTAESNASGTGLTALASLAANAPAATVKPASNSGDSTRSSTPNNSSGPMASQYPATAGGNAQPPTCANCKTSTTPLWRRDESGSVLCNACGLFLKLHGRPRPISLKTDVIKSRNRVKTSQTKKRDSQGGQDGMIQAPNGYPAAHPDVGLHAHQHGLPPGYAGEPPQRGPSPAQGSRSNTPSLNQNHAPPHIFDTVTLPSDTFASPSLPAFSLRNPSPAPSPLNGTSSHNMDPPQGYEALSQANQVLRTRVSELEVINDLFKGRVTQLEASEQEAQMKVAELERRIAELQTEGPSRKKARTSETNGDGMENGGTADTTSE